jgi:hypothetical protein
VTDFPTDESFSTADNPTVKVQMAVKEERTDPADGYNLARETTQSP